MYLLSGHGGTIPPVSVLGQIIGGSLSARHPGLLAAQQDRWFARPALQNHRRRLKRLMRSRASPVAIRNDKDVRGPC
jgi:hypothetical protein